MPHLRPGSPQRGREVGGPRLSGSVPALVPSQLAAARLGLRLILFGYLCFVSEVEWVCLLYQ